MHDPLVAAELLLDDADRIGEGSRAICFSKRSLEFWDRLGVGDRTLMLEYGTYSVISPEGCASILWKDAAKARDAAEQLGLTAKRLKSLGLVDKVVREPIGGAHRNPRQTATRLKAVLMNAIDELEQLPVDTLLQRRYERLRSYGAYEAA